MSGIENLRALAAGTLPSDDGLLGNTRCTWGGVELLSQEAILAEFTARPFGLEGELLEVETGDGAALLTPGGALFADTYDGRIGRLWRIGDEPSLPPAPAVDVAFDVDLRQERGNLSVRAEDHPGLDSAASEWLIGAAHEMLEEIRRTGKLRVRGFVIRAFGDRVSSAALIGLYTMSNEISRAASFSYAAIGGGSGKGLLKVIEEPRPRPWTPRL